MKDKFTPNRGFPAGKLNETSAGKHEESNMINEHYNYILSQIICPDFKAMVNWHNLSEEHVKIEEKQLKKWSMKNFIILVALKLQ